jgi:eukaryotic-like serine/threonine-protein kinase
MIRLHLLGAIDLRDENGREVQAVLAQPKRLALLAYLAAASPRGPHRRDALLGIFWPELDQEHARNALSKAVHFLRRSLGEGALVSRSAEELGLDGALVWTDVAAFGAALDGDRVDEALGLYRGDLLPSFFVPDAPGFEEWLERERTDLRARAAEAARLLAERLEVGGDATRAIACARRAVALSNGDERPLRRLLELLDKLGDRSAALHAYDTFARRLAAELEVEPGAETVALIERIRASGPSRPTTPAAPIIPNTGDPAREAPPARELGECDVAVRQGLRNRLRRPTTAAAIAGLGLIGALVSVRLSRSGPITGLDADLVAVAPFEVLDPKLELWREGIVDVLSRDLDGAGRLRTVSPAVAIQRWRGRAEAGAAQALGRRTGARLVVFGQVMGSGADSVRLRATLADAGGGRTIGEVELRDAAIHMDGLLESLTLKLLQELGRDRPVGAVRQGALGVRPLPALKAFLRGEQFYRRMLWDSAAAHYDHAIALDSGFALAHYRMAMAVGWNSEQSKRYRAPEEYARRAALLNRGQTTRDSLLLVYGPFEMLRGPADAGYFARYRQGLAVLERASQLYPGDPEVWYMLGEARDHIHSNDVTLAQTLDAFDRAIELDSTFGPAYKHTVEFAIRLGDTDRARRYAAAYLASTRTGVSIPSLRIDGLLLDPASAGSAEAARLVDTVAGVELWLSWWDLAQWPDSGETSIRLARALLRPDRSFVGAPPYIVDSINRRKILARMLAFRGRLREAYRTAPPYSFRWPLAWLHPFPDLALLGAVPADFAAAMFGRMLRGDSLLAADGEQRDGLAWWNAARDSASLALFARRADSAARYRSNPIDRAHLRALAAVARAYLVLAKGDSADGLRAFAALPDSLCLLTDCFFDKLTQMRLAAALGQDRSAAEIFDRWIFGRHLSPVGVLGTLERGRIAERLGQRDKAIESYRFVADVWRNADPELQPYVAEAREGLKRVVDEIH